MSVLTPNDDLLTTVQPADVGGQFFDRFYFNMHGHSTSPLIMVGIGIYPGQATIDGYVIRVDNGTQRNLRFSDILTPDVTTIGPFRWQIEKPLEKWRLTLAANPLDVEFDLTWSARTAPWATPPVLLDDGKGGRTSFNHFFQSGTYAGDLNLDGRAVSTEGWLGQRDRSRGVRPVSGGQGLHLWVQAQMANYTIAFMFDEDREHRPTFIDGAILFCDGITDAIVDVEHNLLFDGDLDFLSGSFTVRTASGESYSGEVDGSAGGGFLSGGGYGGWHGVRRTANYQETEVWPLDGSVHPRMLDTPLTDRSAVFRVSGETGHGVFEFAHSRSSKYTYRPRERVIR